MRSEVNFAQHWWFILRNGLLRKLCSVRLCCAVFWFLVLDTIWQIFSCPSGCKRERGWGEGLVLLGATASECLQVGQKCLCSIVYASDTFQMEDFWLQILWLCSILANQQCINSLAAETLNLQPPNVCMCLKFSHVDHQRTASTGLSNPSCWLCYCLSCGSNFHRCRPGLDRGVKKKFICWKHIVQ